MPGATTAAVRSGELIRIWFPVDAAHVFARGSGSENSAPPRVKIESFSN